MPRKPKFIHPVRVVRQVVGKSQPQFARLVGTSPATIQSIELGRLAVSADLADRISVATAVLPESIQKNRGSPKDLWGQPYSTKSVERFRDGIRDGELLGWSNSTHQWECEWHLDALFRAAFEKGKFWPVLHSFDRWLQSTRDSFGLKESTERIMIEKHPIMQDGKKIGHHVWQPTVCRLFVGPIKPLIQVKLSQPSTSSQQRSPGAGGR